MSSIGPNIFRKSFAVAATVQAYHVVSYDTATSAIDAHVRAIHWPTETFHVLGISQDYADTTSGQFAACPVISFGYAKVAAGASVSAGALLMPVTGTGYAIESLLGGTFNTGSTAFNTSGSKLPRTLGVALEKGSLTDAVLELFVSINNNYIRVA